jgi:hypothetical protein
MVSVASNLQDPTVTHRLFQLITGMSDDERRTLLKLLENGLLRGKCRRGYFRKSLRLPVTFAVGQRAHRNFIRDISLSGVFIVTGIPFQVGEQLRIVLRDKDNNNPVKILGRIARVTTEGIGVEFFALNNAKKTAILSLASAG